MASDQIVMAALGRPFTLGMLYDARKDELNPVFTLWDKTTLEEKTRSSSKESSTYQITASDSFEAKSALLDIEASLKASFLGGLVEVGGSASYLNDRKKSNKQSRVTFQYKATTIFEQLTVAHLDAGHLHEKEAHQNCSATHVVTGILYGANAFFVFDSEKLDTSSAQSIQGSMEALMKKIPKMSIEGSAGFKLDNEEKALTEKFSCKFYGDFILDSNPASFEDAVKTYQQLPQLLRQNQKLVPVKVWLTPLKKLEPSALELKGEICLGLLRKVENTLERMREIEVRCNDSLEEKVVEMFPQISKRMKRFNDLCQAYTSLLQETMREKFPSIRAGTEDDRSVEKLFDAKETSAFSHENLSRWLNNEERKINVIQSCVELQEVLVVQSKSELDRMVFDRSVENVLCFVFTSLDTADPYLNQMSDYLHLHDPPHGKSFTPSAQDRWFFSQEVIAKMREKATYFHGVAKALKKSSRFRFLMAVLPNEKYEGATIYHYRNGALVTEDFSRPEVQDVTTVTDRQHLIWYTCDLNLDRDTAYNYLRVSEDGKRATYGAWQTNPDLPQRFDTRPQVLCREGLTGRHYWEVEWTVGGTYVGVGVTYEGIVRKGNGYDSGLGSNVLSWYFGLEKGLCAYHNGRVWSYDLPPTGCSRVGVFLDWPAGSLSFYNVSHNTLSHLYTFKARFTEPLFPGFYIYSGSTYAALCTDL